MMEFVTIIVIAVGLAMDAFAVSVASGAAYQQLDLRHAFRMAFFFGVFQAFMPLAGSLAGVTLKNVIASYDHWVAFGLLTVIGGKMIYESFTLKRSQDQLNPASVATVLILAIATSIDALAVGVTLSIITSFIFTAVMIIGLITFGFSLVGTWLGRRIGHLFENRIEIAGGIILIAMGLKILGQHLL
jgi:putative Mn2+ efflux pump MntP